MDVEELVSILQDKFTNIDRRTVRAVLEENDNRLAAAEEALRSLSARQDSGGAGPSGRPRNGGIDEREVQMRRDEMLARQMQSHSFADSPSRGYGSGSGSTSGGGYGGSGGGYGGYVGSSGNRGSDESDVWTDALNAVSTSMEQNIKVAASYASSLSSWASTLIANLDPTSLLFEDDDEYDGPLRPPPDKTKDQEGIAVGRTLLTQRPRNVAPPQPRSPTASEVEGNEEDEEEEPLDFSSPVAAVTAVTAWLGGDDDDISYAKKDK